MSESPFRLPRTVVPDHYDITLDVDPARDTFAGTVGIDLRVLESADRIVLNTAELDLDEVVLSIRFRRDRCRGREPRRPRTHDVGVGDRSRRRFVPPRHHLSRNRQRPAPGPLPIGLRGRGGCQASHRHVTVPADGRPPHPPLLGRARLQGHVPHHDDRAGRRRGLLERRRGRAWSSVDGRTKVDVRHDHEDVDLPARVHRRTVRGHRAGRRPRYADQDHRPARQPPPHRRGDGERDLQLRVHVGLLRDPLPGRQARPHRRPRLRRRRDGERRAHRLPGRHAS